MSKLESRYLNDLVVQVRQELSRDNPVIIGISGNIAVGKTTFAKKIVSVLDKEFSDKSINLVCTDSFLYTNKYLKENYIFNRKGFPESYDNELINDFINSVTSHQRVKVPVYSHKINDISEVKNTINKPDIIVVEGLITLRKPLNDLISISIFLEANEEDVFEWYQNRCYDSINYVSANYENFNNNIYNIWVEVDKLNYQKNIEPTKNYADNILVFNDVHELVDVKDQLVNQGGINHAVCN